LLGLELKLYLLASPTRQRPSREGGHVGGWSWLTQLPVLHQAQQAQAQLPACCCTGAAPRCSLPPAFASNHCYTTGLVQCDYELSRRASKAILWVDAQQAQHVADFCPPNSAFHTLYTLANKIYNSARRPSEAARHWVAPRTSAGKLGHGIHADAHTCGDHPATVEYVPRKVHIHLTVGWIVYAVYGWWVGLSQPCVVQHRQQAPLVALHLIVEVTGSRTCRGASAN
jgi:hypothetical protein